MTEPHRLYLTTHRPPEAVAAELRAHLVDAAARVHVYALTPVEQDDLHDRLGLCPTLAGLVVPPPNLSSTAVVGAVLEQVAAHRDPQVLLVSPDGTEFAFEAGRLRLRRRTRPVADNDDDGPWLRGA